MKRLIITVITLAASACWGTTDPYYIPDSFVEATGQGEIVLNDLVFGMPLWDKGMPDEAIQHSQSQWIENRSSDRNDYGLNRAVHYVETPSLIVMKSDVGGPAKPTQVIFPGGSFVKVVLDKEGIDVARWYCRYGFNCVIVKYRTSEQWENETLFQSIHADAQRALQIVRSHADEWSIDPNRIGIMGFSAGGYLAHSVLFDQGPAVYGSYDAISQVPFYPDFCSLVYAAWIPYHSPGEITAGMAPTFLTGCRNDSYVDATNYHSIANGLALLSIPSEVLLFDTGGHGFGLGIYGGEVTAWPSAQLAWMSQNGFMSDPDGPVANTNSGTCYYSPQCAIYDANTGDTLVLQPGIYSENLTLEQDLTLQSVDPNDPFYIGGTIIQGDQQEPVLTLSNNTSACTLAGLTLRAGSVGVQGTATQATLLNCRLMDNGTHGMELFDESTCQLSHCLITANGQNGIMMHEKTGRQTVYCEPVIEHCVIADNGGASWVGGIPAVTESLIQE